MLAIKSLGLGIISLLIITACVSEPTLKPDNPTPNPPRFKPPANNCRLLSDGSYICPHHPNDGCSDVYLPDGSKGAVCG